MNDLPEDVYWFHKMKLHSRKNEYFDCKANIGCKSQIYGTSIAKQQLAKANNKINTNAQQW